jgi:nitroreductase
MREVSILEKKIISIIILDTHVMEKGLTMPETRLGFGKARLNVLINNILNYFEDYNNTNTQVLHGVSVIEEYFLLHKVKNFILDDSIKEKYNKLKDLVSKKEIKIKSRRQIDMSKEDYFAKSDASFFEFSETRSSIRNWTAEKVDLNLVLQALDLCRNTPSACNRQSVRVHLYTDKTEIDNILEIQGGNRGFGHLSSFLIVVTFEPSVFFEENERNSGFVDGGMYCMNILYALHANKIAACILNTAHSPKKDVNIRKCTNIPSSEIFVGMIAGGIPPTNFMIAKSFRYPLGDILLKH